ncbi:uncharacterized protein HD556DRAFT_1537867 [Suillus plorans]|uniref:Uncharacterized protein n=1 Tax=Suillus plorans TaxID=116603 RepID=A0A9P7DEL4_9AGAM|nr:uncharacterized protein HD556DRAFT_1537867 [Suillus plorans]KAG1790335.1 hypothetical protein HD556DRAFT_1537867 [Suillus plorans]
MAFDCVGPRRRRSVNSHLHRRPLGRRSEPVTLQNATVAQVTIYHDGECRYIPLLRDVVGRPNSNTSDRITAKVDTSLYGLSSEEAAFFKAQIGIDDDEDLKRHILEVTRRKHTILNISSYPVYEHILKLGGERPDAVLLDLGYCFGVDARKAAADGFPAENVIASNIINEFLELGHELFRTTSNSYPGCFFPGDVFDPEILSIAAQPNNPQLSICPH